MTPSEHIDQLIAETTDWRGETLASVRKAILAADPAIVEEWKWMGSPVWSRDGILVVDNAHKEKVQPTFARGAKRAAIVGRVSTRLTRVDPQVRCGGCNRPSANQLSA